MRARHSRFGLLLALLAVAWQLALGAIVPAAAMPGLDPLAGFGVICHAHDGGDGRSSPHHRAPDCQVCPLCAAVATPAATLAAAPFVPRPPAIALPPAAPPLSAAASPVTRPLASRPRGPPPLV